MLGRLRRLIGAPVFPAGHFYSPVVRTRDLIARRGELWPSEPATPGIEWNDPSHRQLLGEAFPRHLPEFDYPERRPAGAALAAFHSGNPQFGWLDARALFVLLREWRPRRVIEVGSGFSSLLIADVNRRWFDGGIEFTCIEPHPPSFLRQRIAGITRLIDRCVQDVPPETFAALGAGDLLFIDSSHVAKTGSDVNRLVFDVLPRLAPGTRIHFHDIFLPHDYPPAWVLGDNRSWNEQYVVRALLMYTRAFRIDFGCSYAFHAHPERVRRALAHPQGHAYGGSSLWLTKVA